MELIPAIDLRGGRCVRLLEGSFDAETRYDADPVALAAKYAAAGANWIHIVDLDGARDGERANAALIRDICASAGATVQVGGGIRDADSLADVLALGAGRAVVGSVAITSPDTVLGWLAAHGGEHLVLAVDVRLESAVPYPYTHGWTRRDERSLWHWLDTYAAAGLRHLLCTDIARDGTLQGPSRALYRAILTRYPSLALQASGGVGSLTDLSNLAADGAHSAIAGKALLDGRITLEEVSSFLPNA